VSDTDAQPVAGTPYNPDSVRWVTCHRGQQWCGWHRTSNGRPQLIRILHEREQHEADCNGGLIIATA
jgi:hypothetical protein